MYRVAVQTHLGLSEHANKACHAVALDVTRKECTTANYRLTYHKVRVDRYFCLGGPKTFSEVEENKNTEHFFLQVDDVSSNDLKQADQFLYALEVQSKFYSVI